MLSLVLAAFRKMFLSEKRWNTCSKRSQNSSIPVLSDYPVTLGYVCCIIVAAVAISTYMYVHLYSRSYIHNGFTVRFANNILYVRSVQYEQSSRWRF